LQRSTAWDFGTLGVLATDAKQKPFAGVLTLATFVVALTSAWFVDNGA
jgi:hypothetical protein